MKLDAATERLKELEDKTVYAMNAYQELMLCAGKMHRRPGEKAEAYRVQCFIVRRNFMFPPRMAPADRKDHTQEDSRGDGRHQ